MAQDLSRRWAVPILTLLLIAAALLRLVDLGAVPFWYDEVWLRDVLVQPDLHGALEAGRALTHRAVPPPLYLWLHQQFSRPLGQDETALRLYPALCGLASVLLSYLWAARLAGRRVGLMTAALFAVHPFFVYYSQETKQYSHDLMIALAVLVCTARVLERPTRAGLALLGAVVLVGALSSLPLTFLLPGLACLAWWRRRRGPWLPVASVALVGAAIAGVSALRSRADLTRVQWDYWAPFFAATDSWGAFLEWQGRTLAGLVDSFVHPRFGHVLGPWEWAWAGAALALVVLGAVLLGRRGLGHWVWMLVVPALALEAAAVAGRYPLMNRLVLFLAPVPVVFGMVGLERLLRPLVRSLPGLLLVLAAGMAWEGLWVADSGGVWSPKTRDELRLAQTVRKRYPDHDLYLHFETLPQLGSSFWPIGEAKEMETLPTLTEGQLRSRLDQRFADSERGCLVYVHPGDSPSLSLERYVPRGHALVEQVHQPGLEVLRFARRAP